MKTILVAGLLMLAPIAFVPTAQAGTACSVSDTTDTCTFTCAVGDSIHVSARSNSDFFDVSISGSCGGASAGCTAKPEQGCQDKSDSAARATDNTGVCRLSGGKGTGSCGADGTTEECTKVLIVCCPPAICSAGVPDPNLGELPPVDLSDVAACLQPVWELLAPIARPRWALPEEAAGLNCA